MSQTDVSYRKFYLREIGLLCPDLPVTHIYPSGNTLINSDRTWTVHRDVKSFVREIERTKRKYQINAPAIAQHCLRGSADEWFKRLFEPIQQHLTKDLEWFCVRLIELFDSKEQKQRIQQQAEEARIAKEQEEARLTAFACRRCPAKFPSNTKLHQHIQDHHQKTKPAKPASEPETSLSNPEPTPNEPAVIAPPTSPSSEPAYHTPTPRNEPTISSPNSEPTSKAMPTESTPSEPAKSSPPSKSFAERCASYINYPPTQYPPAGQLLTANFTSKQNPDIPGQVYCEACDLHFYGFSTHENPYQKHIEYSPTCPWVLAERAPKPSTKAVLTPPATPPPRSEPTLVLTPPTSPAKSVPKPSLQDSPIAPTATPRKQISSAEITSRPTSSPLRLRLPIATPKNVPKVTEIETACPPTPPPTPPRNLAPKHQEQKSYLTIHDLFRMFDGKPKRTELLHTNDHTKKSKSPPTLSNQAKITAYFKPAANQNRPITQDSKSSNPKSFHQRMAAEIARTKSLPPTKTMSEISANLPYKMTLVSRSTPSTESSRSSVKTTHVQASSISASSHVCRTCSGTSRSSLDLQHTYDRPISAKRLAEAMRTFARMIERPGAIQWLGDP